MTEAWRHWQRRVADKGGEKMPRQDNIRYCCGHTGHTVLPEGTDSWEWPIPGHRIVDFYKWWPGFQRAGSPCWLCPECVRRQNTLPSNFTCKV
jgi:hypothetical protein